MTDIARKKILIVDDDRAIRRVVELCLRGLPADQISVGEGAGALDVLRLEKIALVVTDLVMPGIGGFELIRAMRADAALRDIPVILLSRRF